jgi:ComF family protein
MFLEIEGEILNILFPVHCVSCQKAGVWLCEQCFLKIEIRKSQVCPFCENVPVARGKICPRCENSFREKNRRSPLDGLVCASSYKNKLLSRLTHLFKYGFISDLSDVLGRVVAMGLLENNAPIPDFIVPVPLHQRRLRWRGFNQAELLANFIGQNLAPGFSLPIKNDIIFRQKYAGTQMKIKNYKERKRNISGAFSVRQDSSEIIKDKDILLVDDIATTGATLFEIGRILKQNGARKVWGAVIARQEID